MGWRRLRGRWGWELRERKGWRRGTRENEKEGVAYVLGDVVCGGEDGGGGGGEGGGGRGGGDLREEQVGYGENERAGELCLQGCMRTCDWESRMERVSEKVHCTLLAGVSYRGVEGGAPIRYSNKAGSTDCRREGIRQGVGTRSSRNPYR